MKRHTCPGEDCPVCEQVAEDRALGDRDLDGSMANREADRFERRFDEQWT